MLTARRKITKRMHPLGWCMDGKHFGLEQSESETEMLARQPGTMLSRCPGKVTFSSGIWHGKEMFCICKCHGERALPAWQVEHMATFVAEPVAADDDDETPDDSTQDVTDEASPGASETPEGQPNGHTRRTEAEGAEEPSGTVDAPVEDGNERPAEEEVEWTSNRSKPMPVPGGFVERVTFPSPSKPDQRVIGWVAYNDKSERLARVWQRQQAKDLVSRLLKPEMEE